MVVHNATFAVLKYVQHSPEPTPYSLRACPCTYNYKSASSFSVHIETTRAVFYFRQ